MNKIILALLILVLSSSLFGQTSGHDTVKKNYKNIIVFDATAFAQQFFNLNPNSYSYNPYYICYRRIFNNNSIRLNAGGYTSSDNENKNDTINNIDKRTNYVAGLGFEHNCSLSNRWSFYFGTDAKMIYSMNYWHHEYSLTRSSEFTDKSYYYGLSPLLGVVLKINSRISVSTEMSFDIFLTQSTNTDLDTPSSKYDSRSKNTGFMTDFRAPTAVNFRILF